MLRAARQALPLILCLMSIPGVARTEVQPPLTVQHLVQLETGTDQDRQLLSIIPLAKMMVAKPFKIARVDLNDDGTREIVLMSSSDCGSTGCPTFVFENRRGTAVALLTWTLMLRRLAVTNEKVGAYRALVPVDDHGAIITDKTPGPRLGKQILYATPYRAATDVARPSILNPEACAGDPSCTEISSFAAIVTDFRLSLARGERVITATVRFINKLDRTLVVGYVEGSGIITDEQGNRYKARESRAMGEFGTIVGEQPEPKFRLSAGEVRDAHFEFVLQPGNHALGTQYTIDLTVGELVPTPSEAMVRLFGRDDPDVDVGGPHQWRLDNQHPLHFSGFTDAGMEANVPPTSTPAGARLTGAYFAKGGPSMLERMTFTSENRVTIEDGVATQVGTYVIRGRKVIVTLGPGWRWVFTIDGKGCLIGDVVSIRSGLCRQ